jgi:DNA-binding NarL/FixJ family response regulator
MRVAIGEDAVLTRAGIARVLSGAGFEVVAEVGDAEELVERVRELKPDVAVIDIRMPPRHADDGLEAARRIRSELPDTGILMLSQYVDEHYVMRLLEDGAEGVGYLLKDRVGEVDRFVESVRRVAEGGSALDPEVVAHMVGSRSDGPLSELTQRERDVLARMAEGLSNKAIAEEFEVSERAVEHHVTSIFGKLGLSATGQEHRRVLAVLAYLQA